MALPTSGPLSFQDIATELGVNPPLSLAAMSTTAGFTAPFEVTDFYGYSGGGVITNGLVLYVDASNPASYPGTGTTWFDLSPNGYNATLSGNATYNSGNGGFISLQSNTGFINFGSGSAGSNTSSYTWGAWVKFTDVSSTNIFMARGNDSSSGWNLAAVMLTTGFNASMVTTVPFTSQINSVYSTTPVANTWYYYTAVFDAGVSLKVYINGVLRATQNSSSTNLRNSGEGWSSTLGTTYYNADYGSMIAYNTALTDAEVLQNYDATKERFGIVTSGLVLNLDASNPSSYSGTGTTWTDLSGNGNDMTMSGTVPFAGTGQTKYFSYNGTPNYFQGVNNFTSNISTAITISIVASITDLSQRTALFSKFINGGAIVGYVFEVGTIPGLWTNTTRWFAAGTGGQSTDYRGTTALTQNQVYLLTLTYNQSTGANAIYFNGTQISASQVGTNTVAADFSQGATPNLTGNYGPGLNIYSYMNEYMVLVYNTALTSTEVTQNYTALQARFRL